MINTQRIRPMIFNSLVRFGFVIYAIQIMGMHSSC